MGFTQEYIAALPAKSRIYLERDRENAGFVVQVRPSGHKAFIYIYEQDGKRQQVHLGEELEQAKVIYDALKLARKAQKIKPVADVDKPELSIWDAWRDYETTKGREALSKQVRQQYGSIIHDLTILYPNLSVSGLTGRFIKDYLKTFENYIAKPNQVKSALSCLCRHLVYEDYLDSNPCAGLPSKVQKPKKRKMSKSELQTWLPDLLEYPMAASNRDLVVLILHTGTRATEACEARIEEVDLDAKRWIIDGERTKNGRDLLVPFPNIIVELFRRNIGSNTKGYVFANKYGKPPKRWSPRQSLKRMLDKLEIEHASIHDLRRTMAHHMNSLGIPSALIGQILNHTPSGITNQVYIQAGVFDGEADKRHALNQWAGTLQEWGLR